MGFFIAIIFVTLVTVVPVMIAARALNAGKSGFWICLVAVFLSSVAGMLISDWISRPLFAVLASFVTTVVIYAIVLNAKFIQSLVIAILANIIQVGMIFLLAWLGFSIGHFF